MKAGTELTVGLAFWLAALWSPAFGGSNASELRQAGESSEVGPSIPLTAQLDRPKSSALTDGDLRFIAEHYVGVSDRTMNLTSIQIERLHALNPALKVLRYINFSSVYGKNRVRILLESHPDWVLRDRKRQPVEAFYDPGVAIDPANPEVVAHLASECRQAIAEGYDGVMADETFMVNPLPRGFGGINRETGRVYSLEEWRLIKYESLQAAKVALGPGKLLLANSIAYGEKYFREQGWRFLEVVDGVVAENFRGPSGWPVTRFFDLGGWKQNVAMVEEIQRRGKSIIATAKYSREELRRDPEAVHQHQLFTLGTFLLATDSSSAFSSSMREPGEVANDLHRKPFPFEFAPIGRPLGKYRIEGDLYVREFERATVAVNPTFRSLTWRPPGSEETVVLGGHSARIELDAEPHL